MNPKLKAKNLIETYFELEKIRKSYFLAYLLKNLYNFHLYKYFNAPIFITYFLILDTDSNVSVDTSVMDLKGSLGLIYIWISRWKQFEIMRMVNLPYFLYKLNFICM